MLKLNDKLPLELPALPWKRSLLPPILPISLPFRIFVFLMTRSLRKYILFWYLIFAWILHQRHLAFFSFSSTPGLRSMAPLKTFFRLFRIFVTFKTCLTSFSHTWAEQYNILGANHDHTLHVAQRENTKNKSLSYLKDFVEFVCLFSAIFWPMFWDFFNIILRSMAFYSQLSKSHSPKKSEA